MATGRSLLSEEPPRRLKVWYHNGEENWDELCRRLDAVCQYYGVSHSDLEGWLCMTNPQSFRCGWRKWVQVTDLLRIETCSRTCTKKSGRTSLRLSV